MYNWIDTKQYTNDQLIEKIAELNRRINFFSYSGSGIVDSFYSLLEAFENEYRERQFMEQWKLATPYVNKVIETEPDLKTEQKEDKKDKPKRNRMFVPVRSDKPVVPDKD